MNAVPDRFEVPPRDEDPVDDREVPSRCVAGGSIANDLHDDFVLLPRFSLPGFDVARGDELEEEVGLEMDRPLELTGQDAGHRRLARARGTTDEQYRGRLAHSRSLP